MPGSVRLDVRLDGVGLVTLDRPDRLNALTSGMYEQLGEAYRTCDADPAVRAVVLTGAGRAFSAGADLSRDPFQAPTDPDAFQSSPVRPTAFELSTPVIAAVNGHAVGIGMTLALQCDLRLMAAEAKWGIVQVRHGVVGDAHSHFTLVRAVGVARAAEILLTGTLFTADEALRLGVASQVLPAADVLPAALELARTIAADAQPAAVAWSKRILWASAAGASPDEVDALERQAHLQLLTPQEGR